MKMIIKSLTATIVIRNGKICSGNTGSTVNIFAWTWNIWGGRTEHTSKQQKILTFVKKLLIESDFEVVLATFCCCDYGAKASEAVQKITTDQKEYRKCFSCIIICWIAKIYLSINNSEEGWLQGYLRRS